MFTNTICHLLWGLSNTIDHLLKMHDTYLKKVLASRLKVEVTVGLLTTWARKRCVYILFTRAWLVTYLKWLSSSINITHCRLKVSSEHIKSEAITVCVLAPLAAAAHSFCKPVPQILQRENQLVPRKGLFFFIQFIKPKYIFWIFILSKWNIWHYCECYYRLL